MPMNFTSKTMTLSTKKLSFLLISSAVFFAVLSRPVVAQDTAGADVYKAKCLTCHAKDGSGNTPVGKKSAVSGFAVTGSSEEIGCRAD